MTGRETADEINALAAAWVVRMDRDDDPATAEALSDWLAGDRRRRGAYLRAQAMWRGVDASRPTEVEPEPLRRTSRRYLLGGGLATAAAGVAAVLWLGGGAGATFETGVGQQKRETLADGSVILLNTASQSRIDLQRARRLVDLKRGEALFSVAHDKARPFIVSAGSIRVEAVGTAFAVRRREGGVEVIVTQGRVRAWSERSPGRFISIDAGHRTYLSDATGVADAVLRSDGIDEALAWKRGMIALDGMTLVEAAAEFNRYNRRQVAVDERFAEKRLVGWFDARDVDGFAKAAATIVGGHVEQDEGSIRITK